MNGEALFAGDIKLPGMMYAQVAILIFGGELKSYDEKAALESNGVQLLYYSNGIAVVADSTWHAIKGIKALNQNLMVGK